MVSEPRTRTPLRWVLWHPHQKLWNWRLQSLVKRAARPLRLGAPLVAILVFVDSVLLYARVLAGRVVRFGPRGAIRLFEPTDRTVFYIDCGVHKQGRQLRWMHTWFGDRCRLQMLGFEASADHLADARVALADVPEIDLRQVALVGPDTDATEVKLYRGPGDGGGDSLFRERRQFELVPATRLSALLAQEFAPLLGEAPVLLRMNIEGSEYDVVDDMVRAGLHDRIDGWFGMWDDVSKLDPAKDSRFREMLRAARITTVTFNDRDLSSGIRRAAIRLALDSAIRRGLARTGPGGT